MEYIHNQINKTLQDRFSNGNPDLKDLLEDFKTIAKDKPKRTEEEKKYFEKLISFINEKINAAEEHDDETTVNDDFLEEIRKEFDLPDKFDEKIDSTQKEENNQNNNSEENSKQNNSKNNVDDKKERQIEMLEKELVEAKTEAKKKPILSTELNNALFLIGVTQNTFSLIFKGIRKGATYNHRNLLNNLSKRVDNLSNNLEEITGRKALKEFFDKNQKEIVKLNDKIEALNKTYTGKNKFSEQHLSEDHKKLEAIKKKLDGIFKDKELFDLKDHDFLKKFKELGKNLEMSLENIQKMSKQIAESTLKMLGLSK